MKHLPGWLKSIDHGRIGEARTRAILLNMFWILERSVDIEGADFIIQRKIWGRNLLDARPPRLGYVQSKYCQDDSTRIEIRSDYVLDSDNAVRQEFFLFVHTGTYDDQKVYFLEGDQIGKHFSRDTDIFHIALKELRSIPDAEIRSQEFVLSKIDNRLMKADFIKNRTFYRYLLEEDGKPELPIDHDYTLPLANYYCDIQKHILQLRKKVRELVVDLKHDTRTLNDALAKTDPVEFVEVFENERFFFLEDYFYKHRYDYSDNEFYHILLSHRKRVQLLRERNMLQQFVLLKKELLLRIENTVPEYRASNAAYICFDVKIDSDNLQLVDFKKYECDGSYLNLKRIDAHDVSMRDFCGVQVAGGTYIIYFSRPSLFRDESASMRYQRHAIDAFDIALLENIFGKDAICE